MITPSSIVNIFSPVACAQSAPGDANLFWALTSWLGDGEPEAYSLGCSARGVPMLRVDSMISGGPLQPLLSCDLQLWYGRFCPHKGQQVPCEHLAGLTPVLLMAGVGSKGLTPLCLQLRRHRNEMQLRVCA